MIRAVLLDLDETLIQNPDASFARGFVQLANSALAPQLNLAHMGTVLKETIQQLSTQRSDIQNNLDLILQRMQAASTLDRQTVHNALDHFYTHDFSALAPLVAPVAGAATLIERLQSEGLIVVIATNPVYPASGIRQRMDWGGISHMEYALITDADTMHFAKPDPAYYAEIIARIGVEPDEALMVGDNPVNDIHPASQIGIHTIQIDTSAPDRLQPIRWLLKAPTWRSAYPSVILPREAILHALRGNLGALCGLIELAPPPTWDKHPIEGEWSLLQIVAHLVESEITTQHPRLQAIMDHHQPDSLPLLTDIKLSSDVTVPAHMTLHQLFEQFVSQRRQTLSFLSALQPSDWDRSAHHSVFGYTTLREMASFTAQHDRMHIQQFCQTLGRCQEA